VADNEKTHVLLSDCIISELGRCEAGSMISATDTHSSTWDWLLRQGFLKSVAEIEQEADSEAGDVPEQPGAESETGEETKPPEAESEAGDVSAEPNDAGGSIDDHQSNELLTRVLATLAVGTQRKGELAKALGCDEATLTSVLIEANGIEHKGGGWYSLIPVQPTE
jgi:hypothetical protein